ncbi:hypothetical protein KSF_092440 [Reticulibacter mediterranei]|uniref:Uncharacterized protein n=1 Tax=Reticulibacter mediterranei TaxID=2778369 RepID=A0A8J3J067_9CHLR|nr:hypothetical protein KSF_092440 [Reticulibacter mediterranei]
MGALRLSLVGSRRDRETDQRCGEGDKRKAPAKTPTAPLCRYGITQHPLYLEGDKRKAPADPYRPPCRYGITQHPLYLEGDKRKAPADPYRPPCRYGITQHPLYLELLPFQLLDASTIRFDKVLRYIAISTLVVAITSRLVAVCQ